MSLLMLLLVLPFSVRAMFRRKRRGASMLFPGLISLYVVLSFLWSVVGLIHSLAAIAKVDPAMKATLLAKGISEAISCSAGVVLFLPLFGAGWLLDRRFGGPMVPPPTE